MQLTGKQIVEKQIIKGYTEEAIQQQGLDLRINRVWRMNPESSLYIDGRDGLISKDKKTKLPQSKLEIETNNENLFILNPGYYEAELMESCELGDDVVLYLKGRSSLIRCGTIIESGQYDAGYKANNMGCFLVVNIPIAIEKGSRICQCIVNETESVTNLYDGQYQTR